jgi:hypothetical protein
MIPGHSVGAISPAAKAILSNLAQSGRKRGLAGQICFVAACICSTWKGFCPWVLFSGIVVGTLLMLLAFLRDRQDYTLRMKLLEILKKQGQAKNVNKVSLEKIFAEFNRIAPS